MGVLNVTPDSFFDGGRYDGHAALERIEQLLDEGAFAIDIGAESTRPGASRIPAAIQLERLDQAVRHAVGTERCWVSVDTTDPIVAKQVLDWGAHVINDVSCLASPELARIVAEQGRALIVMHARGDMAQMAGFSQYPEDGYGDVVGEVMAEWRIARDLAVVAGMDPSDVLFDPGIGFAKNASQSMTVLERLDSFRALGVPLVLGPSRKSFLQLVEQCPPGERLGATVAACLLAAEQGAALLRVHDVKIVRQALAAQRFFRDGCRNSPTKEATCSTGP